MTSLSEASSLDQRDPLARYRERFHLPEGIIYLDGNSLGALPKNVGAALQRVVDREWGDGLIRSWAGAGWFHLPLRVGDGLAPLIGARPGEVAVGDSTSANLFKCLCAALKARPGRRVVVTEEDNFPTDNYIIEGAAGLLGAEIRYVPRGEDPRAMLNEQVAAIALTHVNYRTAAIHDMAEITAAAHRVGALMIWDLSHSTGAMPIDLGATEVDFAVGCTYKYLNGGPGAPAFTYVPGRLVSTISQPLSGWMGHKEPFAFSLHYQPADAIRRFVCGTPQILSLACLQESLTIFADVDMREVRAKSLGLTSLFMELVERECAGHGFEIVTPRIAGQRGSHVSIACANGYRLMRALADRGVLGDFRAPDLMRFGFTPLYCSYVDVVNAVRILKQVLDDASWREERYATVLEVT
jgi:kynureninase